ncbi:MAG: hypothetical protein Q8S19_11200 [Bacillota bacterium]|nr:hypothetical protein [Bacillota bacterium]
MRVRVRALKYGGYRYEEKGAVLMARAPEFFVVREQAATGLDIYSFFPVGQWFYVQARVQGSNAPAFYCKVITPIEHANDLIQFVDLDLVLIGNGRGNWQTANEEQFRVNATTYNYPQDLQYRVSHELVKLREKAEKGGFPFNGFLDKYLGLFRFAASRDVSAHAFPWEFWEDTIKERGWVIDRPIGSKHPRYNYIIYPVDYGYLPEIMGWDDMEQDIFVGNPEGPLVGIVLTADFHKGDREFKLLWGLTKDQVATIHAFFNKEPELMIGLLIERPNG